MRLRESPSNAGKGWGPFTSRQLTTIVCVAIIAAVAIPTAAMAAVGTFTSTTVTPAVRATNSARVANAKGVRGSASATSAGVNRYGVTGNAGGTFGVGVQGTGTKYGVFSNGPLGVAAGKPLRCTGCVTANALANRILLNYNLAPGANSTPITVPANTPVQVMGVQTNVDHRGVASATLLSIPGPTGFLEWTGLESTSGSAITQGYSGARGTHILYLDYNHTVDIEVNGPRTIRVHNESTGQRAGKVVITW